MEDQRAEIAAILARRKTSARALILDLLDGFDAAAYLRAAGLSDDELAHVRKRLVS
jgi:hypothetical protein